MPWRLDWEQSGLAKRVTACFNAISDLGIEVTIYCLGPPSEKAKFSIEPIHSNTTSKDDIYAPLVNSLGFSHEFSKQVKADDDAVLQCFNTTSLFIRHRRYIFTTTNPTYAYALEVVKDEYPSSQKYKRLLRYYATVSDIDRLEYEKADCIIANSEIVKKNIVEYYAVDKSRIEVIPNGVTPEECDFNHNPKSEEKMKIVLFPGTIHIMKGFHYLLDAMIEVRKRIPNVILLACGRIHPFEYKLFSNLIQKKRKRSGVALAGFMPRERLFKYYSLADVCCMPLLFGNMSNALLEAVAHGLPIITTKHSGFPEVSEVGIEVPPKDTKALSEAIITLLSNQELLRKKRENAQRIIKNYYWEDIAKKFGQIYEKL